MPTVKVNGRHLEVAKGTRLTQAIEDAGIDIGHRCGGKCRCTTCRVTFSLGEPDTYTKAEFAKLGLEPGVEPDFRLSCQILCEHEMDVSALMTLENQDWGDTGPAIAEQVEPEAEWLTREELE